MMAKVTLKDVARKCGVSVATASQALRGYATVAKTTQKRVRQAANELGYCPNPVLSALAAKRFKRDSTLMAATLVYLVEQFEPGSAQTTAWPFRNSLTREAKLAGYNLRPESVTANTDLSTRLRKWFQEGVQGIILGDTFGPSFRNLRDIDKFSIISIGGRWRNYPKWNNVRPDSVRALLESVQQVRDRGYKRPGLAVSSLGESFFDDNLRRAFVQQLSRMNPPWPRPYLSNTVNKEAFVRWLDRTRPDVVIAFPALIHWWIVEAGWRVPEDVAYVNVSQYAETDQLVSGYIHNQDIVARRAIRMLDGMLRHGERGISGQPVLVEVPAVWNEGETLPWRSIAPEKE